MALTNFKRAFRFAKIGFKTRKDNYVGLLMLMSEEMKSLEKEIIKANRHEDLEDSCRTLSGCYSALDRLLEDDYVCFTDTPSLFLEDFSLRVFSDEENERFWLAVKEADAARKKDEEIFINYFTKYYTTWWC